MSLHLIHNQKTPTGALVNGLTIGETSARGYCSLDTKKTRSETCREAGSLDFTLTELYLSCLVLHFYFLCKSKLHISLPYFSLLLGQIGKPAPDLRYAPHSIFLRVFLQKIAVVAFLICYLEHCLQNDLP